MDAFAALRIVDYGDAPVATRGSGPLRRGDRANGRRGARCRRDPDRARRRPLDRRAGHRGLRGPPRPGGSRPFRHAHGHRHRGLRRRGVARDADVPARSQRRGRPEALRPDRAPRLLARRARVRVAGGAGDHVDLHARRARRGHRRRARADDRSRRRRPGLPVGRRRRARPGVRARHRHARSPAA